MVKKLKNCPIGALVKLRQCRGNGVRLGNNQECYALLGPRINLGTGLVFKGTGFESVHTFTALLLNEDFSNVRWRKIQKEAVISIIHNSKFKNFVPLFFEDNAYALERKLSNEMPDMVFAVDVMNNYIKTKL